MANSATCRLEIGISARAFQFIPKVVRPAHPDVTRCVARRGHKSEPLAHNAVEIQRNGVGEEWLRVAGATRLASAMSTNLRASAWSRSAVAK